jgi:hypothetical protein
LSATKIVTSSPSWSVPTGTTSVTVSCSTLPSFSTFCSLTFRPSASSRAFASSLCIPM